MAPKILIIPVARVMLQMHCEFPKLVLLRMLMETWPPPNVIVFMDCDAYVFSPRH